MQQRDWLRTCILILAATCCAAAIALPAFADETQGERAHSDGFDLGAFEQDVRALTRHPHRLAGTPEGHAAADYIQERLREIGIVDVIRMQFPIAQVMPQRCELRIGDDVIELAPLRDNVGIPPATPEGGLTGPMIYAGDGNLERYGSRSAEDAIVVLDYQSFENWRLAFQMGAKAVIFLAGEEDTDPNLKHVPIPANFVRLYAPPQARERFDFTADHDQVTLISHTPWRATHGANIIAYLPGTEPELDPVRRQPELMVLSANFDSFGQVPTRSPHARGAANVAALLQTVAYLREHRPRRDVLIAFLDNQAQDRHGARVLYRAIDMPADMFRQLIDERRSALDYTRQVVSMLEVQGDWPARMMQQVPVLRARVKEQADFRRADVNHMLYLARLGGATAEQLAPRIDEMARWDELRRVLAKSPDSQLAPDMASLDTALIEELRQTLLTTHRNRLLELDQHVALDTAMQRLRQHVAGSWIALHVSYNLSDGGPRWSVVPSDSTRSWFVGNVATADQPGHYFGILAACRRAADALGTLTHLDTAALQTPLDAERFAAGMFVSDGMIAGMLGIYNVSLMTGSDARPRDGHPADTFEALDWRRIATFGDEARHLMRALADSAALSQPRNSRPFTIDLPVRWDGTRSRTTGNFAGLEVTGALREDRPAAGAVTLIWPRHQGKWAMHAAPTPLNFTHHTVMPADATGHFELLMQRRFAGDSQHFNVLALLTDDTGTITAISSDDRLDQRHPGRFRINLIPTRGFALVYPPLSRTSEAQHPFRVMGAISNVPPRPNRRLIAEADNVASFFVPTREFRDVQARTLKLFADRGPVLLGIPDSEAIEQLTPAQQRQALMGRGKSMVELLTPPEVNHRSATNLWRLNEQRLQIMRASGITDAAIERMHNDARLQMELARTHDNQAQSQSSLIASIGLSRRIYQPIREAMNDLITAVVILLLLTIPFAFALERLIVCAPTVYGRLGGFVALFAVTFVALYLLHPGFSVATTPIIILLAFVIVLLSSLVIYLLLRKFNTELKELQGQGSQQHAVQLSGVSTLVAAANMGMSTMRRRPLRTALTALTVVLLTFTILCFASVGSSPGVRSIYIGSASAGADADLLVRNLDYSNMPLDVLRYLEGMQSEGDLVAAQWWVTRRDQQPLINITRADDGRSVLVHTILGIDPRELQRWPDLTATLQHIDDQGNSEPVTHMTDDGVYLPPVIRDQLDLKPGDALHVDGYRATFAGVIEPNALQQLRHIDQESALPVDFQDPAMIEFLRDKAAMDEDELANIQRSFVRLSPNQMVVAPAAMVRMMQGRLHVIRVYKADHPNPVEEGRRLAQLVSQPVWARGHEGIERLVFTSLIEVHAGQALIVPLILGGLIVFGTMLGSITDREKEIYTFSALGLAPAHVGLLFFAEAAVYAIVGGVGGQLLAQFVAVVAAQLAQAGLISTPSLNFSSTNALFAIFVVMGTVMVSAIYPALRASRSANPGLARTWKMPRPEGDDWHMVFPFTVSAYDITGVVSYLGEHFRMHDDAGLGHFAAQDVVIARDPQSGNLTLAAEVALAPFDLGVTQAFSLTATPSEIEGVDEVAIYAHRLSGSNGDWERTNRVFIRALRQQFLLWRTLSTQMIENYRLRTLQELGEQEASMTASSTGTEAAT